MVGMNPLLTETPSAPPSSSSGPARHVLWTPAEVADYICVPVGTLANWRSAGSGPDYLKISGSVVRYLPEDVNAWLLTRRVDSSADRGGDN